MTDQVNHISNMNPQQAQSIFDSIDNNLHTMTNYQFLTVMTKYSGYLSYEQRLHLTKKYAKIDGDRQIQNYQTNKKLREEFYNNNIKAKIDPNLPIESTYNMNVARKAAEEENKLKQLSIAFEEAKKEAENAPIQIQETNDMMKNVMNVRAKKVIVKFQDGTISHINEEEEKKAIQEYKNKLKQQSQAPGSKNYDVGMDDEYS